MKKIQSMLLDNGDEIKFDFKKIKWIEVLVKIIVQILVDNCSDFVFRTSEEAVGVLDQL